MKIMTPEKARWTPEQIKSLRKRYGYSAERFADCFRLTVDTIRSWECGRKFPSGPATLVLDALERHINGEPAILLDTLELQTA